MPQRSQAPDGPEDEQAEVLIERVADWVSRRKLDLPATLMLESIKPLSFLGGQMMNFFEPMIGSFHNFKNYDTLVEILEDRSKLERLISRIEAKSRELEKG